MTIRLFTHPFLFKIKSVLERYFTAVVCVAALIMMIVGMTIGLQQSFWFDEGYSILVAQQSVDEIIALVAVDAHPPLYYLLLKAWMSVFGAGEFSLRGSSVLASGLSVIVMAFLLKDLFSKRIALIALPFVLIAPFLLRYSFEIRMYAVVMLIGLIATWVMLRARHTKQAKWWVIYGLLVAVGMYTLYMSVVFWLAHMTWLIVVAGQAKENIVKQPFWLAYFGAAVVFLPWLPTVFAQLSSSALPPYMSTVTLYELMNILGLLMAYSPGWQIGPWLSIFLVIFLAAFAYVFAKIWQRLGQVQRRGLLLLVLCFVVGIIFYTVISLPPNPPRFLERYVVHISIFAYALLGVVIGYGWQLRLKVPVFVLTAISIGIMGLGITTVARIGNYNFQRTQSLQAQTIRQEIGCKDTTFVTAGPFGYIDMKYNFEGCPIKFYYPWDVTLTGGFAPIDKSVDRVKDTLGITSARIAYVYYDDSDVVLTPDGRFREVERRNFDKTYVIIYER